MADSINDTVAVIDYEMGNLFSVERACEHVGLHPVITSDPSVILAAKGAILPGVGAFGDAVKNLKRLDLVSTIREFVATGRPFMGICLGLQLLMSESEEFGHHKGLNLIPGKVVQFPTAAGSDRHTVKVPQVGWNKIYRPPHLSDQKWRDSLHCNVSNNEYMYFVHSFYVVPDDPGLSLSFTRYEGTEYCSSVEKNNLYACQFHPEKSATEGLKIYKNFAERVRQGKGNHG